MYNFINIIKIVSTISISAFICFAALDFSFTLGKFIKYRSYMADKNWLIEETIKEYENEKGHCDNVYKMTYTEETKTLRVIFFNYDLNNVKCLINTMSESEVENLMIFGSPGGDLRASYVLTNYINDNNIAFIAQNYCKSACSFSLFAAKESKVCKNTEVGIHKGKFADKVLNYISETEGLGFEIEEKMFLSMAEKGRNVDLWKKTYFETPNESMFYFDEDTLLKENMIDEIASCDGKESW